MDEGDNKTGYDAEFYPQLEEKHQCPVCQYALRDPMQTTCGHRFCKTCIKQLLRKPYPECPIDNEKLSKTGLFPDNFCKREVMSLLVLCNNKAAGCKWSGTLRDLENHETVCEYVMLCCPNKGCQVTLIRMQLDVHQENDCKYRQIKCQICGNLIIFFQQREHFETYCPDRVIACDNGCGVKVKRCEMSDHIATQCQYATISCRFAIVGCSFKGNRLKVEQHERSKLQDHMQLVLQQLVTPTAVDPSILSESQQVGHKLHKVAGAVRSAETVTRSSAVVSLDRIQSEVAVLRTENQSLESEQKLGKERVEECTKIFEDQREQMEKLWTLIRQLEISFQQLSKEVAACHREIANNGTKVSASEQRHITTQSKMAAIEHRQLGIERNLSVKDSVIAEHNVRLLSLEMTDYSGVLRWKITEVSRRRDEAVSGRRLSVYSPPFFTSRSGYKMCGRAYMNGDGLGKGTHLSVFFVIMRGEFDALLPWPFQQSVTFTLIDQEGHGHVSDTFKPELTSSSFHRPTSDMNVASGCPLFIRLDELISHGFIKDDTLFIRISVDTAGLVHP